MIQWIYETIYTAVGEMFSDINNLGVEIFDLSWKTLKIIPLPNPCL